MLPRLVAACGLFLALLLAPPSRASVSIAVTWDGLMRESSAAAVVTPVEARAVWENGRIYTYTRVHVDRAIAGDLAASDAWVRTMGGIVGKVGQIVDGEPVLAPGRASLLFLHAGPIGAFEVTARGQGQFPVVADDDKSPPHVVRSHTAGVLLPPRTLATGAAGGAPTVVLAADFLHGRAVDDVARDIAGAWGRTHAK